MKGKERLYAVAGGPMEWFKRQWRYRQTLWLGLAVLIVLLLQFQILASVNEINRELGSMDYELSHMENRMKLIAEQVGVSSSDWNWTRGRRSRSSR